MTKYTRIFALLLVMLTSGLAAAPRNMLPRFPELIIEKGLSESFQVTGCDARVKLYGTDAESSVKVTIKNKGQSAVQSSVKFRVLYPSSETQVRVKVNGKQIGYNRDKPRHTFNLQPDESIVFDLTAKMSINYSVDNVRKALREQEDDSEGQRRGFLVDDFTRLFEREKFGRRFMVGPLVSKWGVFPVDFAAVNLEISVPGDFVMVTPAAEAWQETSSKGGKVYKTTAVEGFAAAVFLPETDREDFIQTQKILTSERFMH